jgi:hypothetical protein
MPFVFKCDTGYRFFAQEYLIERVAQTFLWLAAQMRLPVASRLYAVAAQSAPTSRGDFEARDGCAFLLADDGRKTVLTAWAERKKEGLLRERVVPLPTCRALNSNRHVLGLGRGAVGGLLQDAAAPGRGRAADAVDAAVVLAADVSKSKNDEKFCLQRRGYTAAIAGARLLEAIRSGPHGAIALCFIEWSGKTEQWSIGR